MILPYWPSFNSYLNDVFFSPDDGAGPAANPKPDPVTKPPATPVVSAGQHITDAGNKFREAALAKAGEDKEKEAKDQKPEDKQDDPDKPDDKKEDEPDDPNADPNAKPDDKPEGEDLSEDERVKVDLILKEYEGREALFDGIKAWTSTLTPDTQAWLAQAANARTEKLNSKMVEETRKAGAPPTGELTPITIPRSYLSLRPDGLAELPDYNPEKMKPDFLRKFGIDPAAVHAPYDKALATVMKMYNDVVVNANMLHREQKAAIAKRDNVKSQMFEVEFNSSLKDQGYEATPAAKALMPEVRKVAFENGERKPWVTTLSALEVKFPEVFKKVDTKPTSKKEGDTITDGVTTPAPPLGTRKTAAPPAATAKPKPKNLPEAKESFIQAAKKAMKEGKLTG